MANKHSSAYNFENIAKSDFEVALRKGFWRSIFSWLTQTKNELLPFDEVRKHLPMRGQSYIGVKEIPLERIVGSVGRYRDFDSAFLPRFPHIKGRWVNIDRAHLQDIILPPIEAYKIGSLYFVKDGNHRVSVARERGQVYIDAEVIEIEVPIQIEKFTTIDDLIRDLEHAEFYELTRLKELRPNSKIKLTLPGNYGKLIEFIGVHRWFMGEHRQAEVSWEEAVTDWYDNVYKPMISVIRRQKILKEFSGRTEADLYLWITEHLWYLREEYQHEVSLEDAAAHFVENYSPNRYLRQVLNLIGRAAGLLPEKKETAGKPFPESNNQMESARKEDQTASS